MILRDAVKSLLTVVFPKRCDLCGEVIAFDESRCEKCLACTKIDFDACEKCGHNKSECICNNKKPEYTGIAAPYYYADNIVKAVHLFKFYGFKELSVGMANEMYNAVKAHFDDVNFDYVTYIPMTKKKMKKRGYNQAQLLAIKLGELLNVDCVTLLSKIRNTDSQRTMTAKQRKMNLYGAFDLAENVNVKDKVILLVDDVKTTGNTLNECAKVLKGYGAKSVYAASFAITKYNKK